MSIKEAGQGAPAADVRPDAAAPLLRTLGDTGAGVCADGFCEVPQRQQQAPGQAAAPGRAAAPGQAATTGADE
jgi:hypothetical protein